MIKKILIPFILFKQSVKVKVNTFASIIGLGLGLSILQSLPQEDWTSI